jgi:hypothetical protein
VIGDNSLVPFLAERLHAQRHQAVLTTSDGARELTAAVGLPVPSRKMTPRPATPATIAFVWQRDGAIRRLRTS